MAKQATVRLVGVTQRSALEGFACTREAAHLLGRRQRAEVAVEHEAPANVDGDGAGAALGESGHRYFAVDACGVPLARRDGCQGSAFEEEYDASV